MLTSEGDKTTVGWPPHFSRLFGGESLILAAGERHRYLRALLQPAFTAEAVARFVCVCVCVRVCVLCVSGGGFPPPPRRTRGGRAAPGGAAV